MKRNGLIRLHTVTGLFAGLFILALSFSGTILVFRDSIDAFQRPVVLPTKVAVKKITVDSCYKIMQSKYPHALISSCAVAENEQQLFSFSIYDSSYNAGTKTLQVFLHPQTGAVLKTRGGSEDVQHNFMSWLAAFHNSFHAGKTGEWLLGFFAIIFALSIITGIIIIMSYP